jgi:alpha-D-glucose phosphate-specific phosphoglucomutase
MRKYNMDIKFGTDGWRAIIAKEFTFDNIRIAAQAIADYINIERKTKTEKCIIVGYDSRFMSDVYARITAEIVSANDIKVLLTPRATPTPAISFAIKSRSLDAGIVITASHNPPVFNGIKFKTRFANSADSPITKKIESLIGRNKPKLSGPAQMNNKNTIVTFDAARDYIEFLKKYVDIDRIKKSRPSVLVDYMHGAGIGYIESVLGEADIIRPIRDNIDPLFGGISPEPIPKNLAYSSDYIKRSHLDICLALDGDADRIGAIRPDGCFLTSGQIFSIILLHFLENRRLQGSVVKTISSTTLIDRICQRYGLTVFETPIGFKYISALMLEKNILIGGEESGGIGFCGYIPERDGILSSLLLMEAMAYNGKGIIRMMKDIDKAYGRFYYDRIDMEYPVEKSALLIKKLKKSPPRSLSHKRISRIKTYDGIKFILEDSSWLLLRFSGTEPVIRIYAEAGSTTGLRQLLDAGRRLIKGQGRDDN